MRSLGLILLFATSSFVEARTVVPTKSWPAANAMEEARSRFQVINHFMPQLLGWVLSSDQARREKKVAGIPLEYLQLLHSQVLLRRSEITFASETREPGRFFDDGQVRVAHTGSTFHSDIEVNEDLIVTESFSGPVPMEFDAIAAILIHEYAHHLDQTGFKYAHRQLDELGAALRSIFSSRSKSFEIGDAPPLLVPGLSRPLKILVFSSLESILSYADSFYLVTDSEKIWDISSVWRSAYLKPRISNLPEGCEEYGPSSENLAPRLLTSEGKRHHFTLSATRVFFCMFFVKEGADSTGQIDYRFTFEETDPGKLRFTGVSH